MILFSFFFLFSNFIFHHGLLEIFHYYLNVLSRLDFLHGLMALKELKVSIFFLVMLQTQTIIWLDGTEGTEGGFSNFQIIICKHKYNVSSGPILKLIRICHINNL